MGISFTWQLLVIDWNSSLVILSLHFEAIQLVLLLQSKVYLLFLLCIQLSFIRFYNPFLKLPLSLLSCTGNRALDHLYGLFNFGLLKNRRIWDPWLDPCDGFCRHINPLQVDLSRSNSIMRCDNNRCWPSLRTSI